MFIGINKEHLDAAVKKQREFESLKLQRQADCQHDQGATPVLFHRFCNLCGKDLSESTALYPNAESFASLPPEVTPTEDGQ